MFDTFLSQVANIDQGMIGYILSILIPVLISTAYAFLKKQQADQKDKWYNELDAEHQRAQAWLKEVITSGVHMVLANRDGNIDQAKFDAIADAASQKLIEIADKAGVPVDQVVDKVSALQGVQKAPMQAPAPAPQARLKINQIGPFTFSGLPESLAYGQKVEVKVTPLPAFGLLMLCESDDGKTKGKLIEIDQTEASHPDTLRFTVPPLDNIQSKRYRPGGYILLLDADGADGNGNGTEYFLKLQ